MVRGSAREPFTVLANTYREGLQTLNEYRVAALRDTKPRQRSKPAGPTEGYPGNCIEHRTVTAAAHFIARSKSYDATSVGAGGVQGCEGRSPPHDKDASRNATAVNNRPRARDPIGDGGESAQLTHLSRCLGGR